MGSSTVVFSEYQQNIIDAFKNTSDNLFIEALAGTGKTFILVELSKNVSQYSVFIAFNKFIQEELKTRITNPKFKTYTFNGLGYQIMQYNWNLQEEQKLKEDNTYQKKTITIDAYKTKSIASVVLDDFGYKKLLAEDLYLEVIDNTATLFDLCRQRMVNMGNEDAIDDVIDFYELFPNYVPDSLVEILAKMLEMDVQLFRENGEIDFIDQLYITYLMIIKKEWKLEMFHTFENIFVDEAQDLSYLQQLFVGILKRRKTSRLVFVGDKNQAIYSFAGADCRATETIKRLYKTVSFPLPINYRCPTSHLKYVNREFDIPIQPRPNAPKGHIYELSYEEMCKYVKVGDCILSRKNSDLCAVILKLLENGFSVYVKDETLLNNLIKKLNICKKNIKNLKDLPIYIRQVKKEQIEKHQVRMKELIENGKMEETNIGEDFSNNNIDLLECIEVILSRYFEVNKDNETRCKSFDSFITYVKKMLTSKDITKSVQCTTIHQAKGKEYKRVFILNKARVFYELGATTDQRIQESNLSYIAMTRSKDEIFLVSSPPKPRDADESDEYEMEDYF